MPKSQHEWIFQKEVMVGKNRSVAFGKTAGAALLALLLCTSAYAESGEPGASIFSFSGFGTVGLAHSSENKADFIAHDLQAHGAGLNRDWSPKETRI